MRNQYSFAVALVAALSSATNAAIIVNYDPSGLPGSGTAPASMAATAVGDGITAQPLTRGPGLGTAFLANGFSSNDWTTNSSLAIADTNGDYFQWSFTIDATHRVSISSFDTAHRRSAIGAPSNFALFASLDGFATPGTQVASYRYLGRSSGTAGTVVPYQWMTTDTPGQEAGNPILTQDLTGASILQNIAPGSTVSFRLYGWDNGSAASTNTVALGRHDGPLLQGTIIEIPEPTCLALVGMMVLAGCCRRRR